MSVRDLAITYAGYSVPNVDGKVRIDRDRERGFIEFDFAVTGTTEALFAAACVAAEEAFATPYGDLSYTQSGNTLFSGSQASRTFLDAMPSIAKGEHKADTGLSRRYTARVEFGLPADTGNEPYEGLREMFVDVFTSGENRKRVTISGAFTGVGGTTARAKYEALIDTIISDTLSDLSITDSETAETPSVRSDTNNNVCEFVVVLQELIFTQAGSSLDDASLVGQTLHVTRRVEAPGDTPEAVTRLVTIDLSYEAGVDRLVTTDLEAKYKSIRPWLINQMKAVLAESNPSASGSGGFNMALTVEEHTLDPDTNRIGVRMVGLGHVGGPVLERRVTTADRDISGKVIMPVWSGRATDAYVYQGPRVVTRTLTYAEKRVGKHTEQAVIANASAYIQDARRRNPADATGNTPGTNWIQLERNPSATHLRLGTTSSGADTIDVTESALVFIWRYATTPPATTSTPGTGGATTGGPPAIDDDRGGG